MPTLPILKAIDRLKQLAICIVESQEAGDASIELDEPKFEISNDIQTARSIMCAYAGEFQKQELQIMRLVSEWRKEAFPETYRPPNHHKPLGNYGHTGHIERHEDDCLNYKRA